MKRLCVISKTSRATAIVVALLMVASVFSYGLSDVAYAVSANPNEMEGVLANGEKIVYKVVGDENFSAYVDADNHLIYKDPKDGTLKMAKLNNKAVSASKLKTDEGKAWYYKLMDKEYNPNPMVQSRDVITLDELNNYSDFGPKLVGRSKGVAAKSKVVPMLNIVVEFSNCKYSTSYDWSQTVFEDEHGLTKFYNKESYGRVKVVPVKESSKYGGANKNTKDEANDGVIHVTLDRKHGNWGNNFDNPKVLKDMISTLMDAVKKANKYIDFAQYDVNKDGVLSLNEMAINYIIAGYETACKDESPGIWAHQYEFDGLAQYYSSYKPVKVDKVKVNKYVTMGEKSFNLFDLDKVEQNSVSTLVHEFGHLLGLPDLYDTRSMEEIWEDGHWSDYNVELLSIMAKGNWGTDENGQLKATALDPYCRYALGYIKPKVLLEDSEVDVASRDSSQGYNSYIIPTKKKGEFFILENRQARGIDTGLSQYFNDYYNYGTDNLGLAMWHIDESIIGKYVGSNSINNGNHRPGIMPVFDESFKYFMYYPFTNPEKEKAGYKWNTMRYGGSKVSDRVKSGIKVVPTSNKEAGGAVITANVDFDESVVSFVPGKVSVLKASSSKGKVNLKWSKAGNSPDGYRVYVSTSKDGSYKPVSYVKNGSAKTFVDGAKKTKGKTYFYKVRAYKNTFGVKKWGEYSPVVKVKIK